MTDRGDLKARAKQMMQGNLGMLIVCMVIVSAIVGTGSAVPVAGPVLGGCLSGPLTLGTAYIYLNLTMGYKPDVNVLFAGFQRFLDALVLTLLISIFTFLWSLLFVIPGIIKAVAYSQAYYILAEHPEMSAKEALDASVQMMNGHKMDYFVLLLSFLPWMLLSAVTFGLVMLYVVPYVNAACVHFYLALKLGMDGGYADSYSQQWRK